MTTISSGFGTLLGQNPLKPSAEALGDAGLEALARVPAHGAAVAGAFTQGVMMLRDAILGGDRRPAVLAIFADSLQRLRDLPPDWDVAGALEIALSSGAVIPYTVVKPTLLVLMGNAAFAEAFARAQRGDEDGIAALLADGRLRTALTHPLLLTLLQSTVISGPELEFILTTARRFYLGRPVFDAAEQRFCEALAAQCFLNEYAFVCSADERRRVAEIAQRENLSPAQVAVLASYAPLSSYAWAGRLPDSPLTRQQIREPARERELARDIAALETIDDPTSIKVRALYEENPYPRWVMPHRSPVRNTREAYRARYPHADLTYLSGVETPEILVAGCGTGFQLMMSTAGYASYRLTAIDLSRASLAFAARKIAELELPDIRLLQGDLLGLDALPETFDIIEATGVLHHMQDPLQGWRILANRLRPGGVMSVSLYSKIARRGIMALRDWAAAKGFSPTHDGIVAFRTAVLAILRDPSHPDRMTIDAAGLATSHDFYAVSTCRDLFFHPQETEFTIPEIAEMITALGLAFRGFTFPSPAYLNAYRSRFVADPQGLDLANWNQFERENPSLFLGMYAFTVQKPLR